MRRVVIVGGGFAGLAAAQALEEILATRRRVQLTVISERRHFLFTPLLSHVASGRVELPALSVPLRDLLADRTRHRVERVERVDLQAREVVADGARIPFDYAVIAPTGRSDWQGHPQWREHALPCQTGRQALAIREGIAAAFARAAHADIAERRRALTFVVAGGGPTGIELLAELIDHVERDHLRRLDPDLRRCVRFVLAERADRLLPAFSPELSEIALRHLRAHNVDVRTGTGVVGFDQGQVTLSDGDTLASDHLLWCTGIVPPKLLGRSGFETDARGRVPVLPSLQTRDHRGIYIAGVGAAPPDALRWSPSSARQQGEIAARNVAADLAGRSRRTWSYDPDGEMVALGRSNAAVAYRGMVLEGKPARALYSVLSAALIPSGFKRLQVARDLLTASLGESTEPTMPPLLVDDDASKDDGP